MVLIHIVEVLINAPQILKKGAYIYDEKEFLDYGMALRAVNLGYANESSCDKTNRVWK